MQACECLGFPKLPRLASLGRALSVIAGLALAIALQGCAINRQSASVSPDVDLTQLKTFYVVKIPADERRIDQLISVELGKRGVRASSGPADAAPADIDAIVSYEDHWMWDITMYMLELKVFIRAPRTEVLLASGASYHTSLTRKSPEEMVAEVLSNIFSGKKDGTKS